VSQPKVRIAFIVALACIFTGAVSGSSVSFSKKFLPTPNVTRHADLNNDGREDLVTVNTHGGFDVLLSTGEGTYGSPASYTIPGGADTFLLSLGDFNSDGKADVVVIGTDNAVHLFLNNGSGKFSQSAVFPVQNVISLNDIAVGDFNRDGIMDIAFTNALNLTVWFGNGKGGFTVGPTTPVSNTDYLMLGDFDGDGLADLAIGDRLNYDSVDVLYGDGTGHFPVQRLIQTSGNGHFDFNAVDVNGDGKMDIIGSQFYPNAHSLAVFYGNSSRTWNTPATVPLAHCAGSGAIAADMNGDGINDLIVEEADCNNNSQQGNAYITVLTRNRNSTYNPEQLVHTSPYVNNIAAIRADRNTRPDIVAQNCTKTPCGLIANFNTVLLLNNTPGSFPSCAPPNAFEGINVCSPIASTAVSSPVSFAVGAAGQVIMRDVEVWVDGKKVALQVDGFSNYTFLNRNVSLSAGTHAVAIFAAGWDHSQQKKTFTLKVK
jgi:hypothetical protein